ncbi:MAG: DUF2723 domain-containing protein [Deltaproteobacteria bacterium]|nr:DUF2723 domain-containing protein [Deltaproteobacteria bacterium]
MSKQSPSSSYQIIFISFVLALVSLFLYLPRTAITLQHSDGGELATAAVTGSIVHPPGYPLYMLISRGMLAIFGSANPYALLADFSAISQSLAVVMLFFVCFYLSRNILYSFFIALAWSLYQPTILTATDAEVFALHHLLILILILSSVALINTSEKSNFRAMLYGVICGLCVSHHHTTVLWFPLVLYTVFILCRTNWTNLPPYLLGAVVGLSPYLSLFFSKPLQLTFGPIDTVTDLLKHFFREAYGTFSLSAGQSEEFVSYISKFLNLTAYNAPAFILVLFLLLYNWRKNSLIKAFMLCFVLHLFFALSLKAPDYPALYSEYLMRFYSLIALSGAVCCGLFSPKNTIQMLLATALLLIPAISDSSKALEASDARVDRLVDAELNILLKELPKNSLFIANSDLFGMGLLYKQNVEAKREDLIVVVDGMLANNNYREILARRYDLFADLDTNKIWTNESVYYHARAKGLFVFSGQRNIRPKDIYELPIGIAWQWLLAKELPNAQEVTLRLADYCARWPEELESVSQYRDFSNELIEHDFLWPLEAHLGVISRPQIGVLLRQALDGFYKRDLEKTKQFCRLTLRRLTGQDSLENRSYLLK